ncbi:type VI secretion system ImpA family N-terminal domain-containing protein [Paracoccus sp. ME4]|uniref:type VI secretion system protein TssA n=1 Tax=Paracoccus sp. ME4 TaxID=3138066 RepID=UPI00398ACAD5
MTLDDLLQPAAENPPCGPDLERADDPAFVDYYFEAVARLPERYFVPGSAEDGREDRLFDPRSVDLGSERAAILALLERSRDLRLLSLLAQFQILAMRPADFVDTLEIIAAMLAQWPDDLHPQPSHDRAERRAALEALASPTTVVLPLAHLCLLGRNDVSLRRHQVATGRAAPRLSEGDLPGQDVLAPLRGDAAARQVAAAHALIGRALDAVAAIGRHSAAASGGVTPDLSAVRQVLADIHGMIGQARPELRPWTERVAAVDPVAAPPAAPSSDAVAAAPAAPATAIGDRKAAEAALGRVQDWLSRHEPSSAVLLLVVQARQLVGLPLVRAIEALMPERAASVALHLGQGSGFVLPMARLRDLTALALPDSAPASDGAAPPPAPPIASRAEMVGLVQAVEAFFLRHEPSSPVPLILSKARDLLDQDFGTIMRELLAPEGGKA